MNHPDRHRIFIILLGFVIGSIITTLSIRALFVSEDKVKVYRENNKEHLSEYVKVYGDSLYNTVTVEQVEVYIMFLKTHYEEIEIEPATIEYILSLYIVKYGSELYKQGLKNKAHEIKSSSKSDEPSDGRS